MIQVSIHEAKTHLSRLLRRIADGEEVVIARGNTPIAKLVPIASHVPRVLGEDRGLYEVPADFDDPLPEEVLADFER